MSEADRLNRIADANRRTGEVLSALERIEALLMADREVPKMAAELLALRARCAALEGALRHVAEWNFPSGPCFCLTDTSLDMTEPDHQPFCVAARAALSSPATATPDATGEGGR